MTFACTECQRFLYSDSCYPKWFPEPFRIPGVELLNIGLGFIFIICICINVQAFRLWWNADVKHSIWWPVLEEGHCNGFYCCFYYLLWNTWDNLKINTKERNFLDLEIPVMRHILMQFTFSFFVSIMSISPAVIPLLCCSPIILYSNILEVFP